MANNPDEQATRDLVLRHSLDPYSSLADFTRLLVLSIQSGESLSQVTDRWVAGRNPTGFVQDLPVVDGDPPIRQRHESPKCVLDSI